MRSSKPSNRENNKAALLLSLRTILFSVESRSKAHLAVLGTNFFFAINFSLVKMISPSLMGAYAVNVFRVGISVLLFWLVWLTGKSTPGIARKDWGRLIFCSLTGIVLNQTLFIKGLTMTSATHASLLMLATPILVSVFALWALKERFTVAKVSGLVLGVGGSVFLVMQKEAAQHAPDYLTGDLLILLNAIFYSMFFIAVKPLMQRYSPLHVIRWVFTIGIVIMLPLGWPEVQAIHWGAFDWKFSLALFAIAFTGTFLAYYFNAYGLFHLGAAVTGTYIYTQPVFAVLIAMLFLNESFSWQKALSAVLIFGGVYLVSFRKNSSRRSTV